MHTRYNITQITNYDEMRDKTDSEYMIFDERELDIWRSTKYNTSEYKRIISETHVQQRYKKSVKSNALHISRKRRNYCRVTNAIVELVDIFPTIADLAGVPVPICQNDDESHRMRSKNISFSRKVTSNPCSEGITLLPLVENTLRCQVRHLFQVIIFFFFCTKQDLSFLYICKHFRTYLGKERPSVNIRDRKYSLRFIPIAISLV